MTIKRKKKMHNEKETGWLAPAELVTVFTIPNREEVESLLKSGKELPDLQKRRITVDEICEIRALRRVPTLTTSEQEDRIELGKRQAEKEIRSNLLSSPQLLESFAEIVRPQFQLLIETSLSRLRPNTLRTKFRLSDKEQQLTIENILEGFSSFSAFASETFNLAISSRKWSKTEEQSLISFWNMMASTFPLNESMKIAWDFGIQELTNRNASDELLLKHILMTEERVSLEVLKQTVTRKAEVFGVSDERVINNTWLFLIGLLEIAGDQKKPDILIDKLLISTRDNKPLEMCALVCPRWVYFANNDFGVIPHLGDHIEKETNTLYSGLSER